MTTSQHRQRITIAEGDGIGPEIMHACLRVLAAAGANFETESIEIGERVYLSGNTAGIADSAWDKLIENRVFYKAPITTPQGGGYKSLNVTVRKTLGLFANVRPVRSLHPFVRTKHPTLNMLIVRENEEDLYAGIEHRQTEEVYQCLKLMSRPGSEKIIRYAFELARNQSRGKVTCMIKDNIMKLTDGMFHKLFDELGQEYPEIEKNHWIIDIGMARVADTPEIFDVIVLPNLYGDILSDVAAQVAGSVGLAGSANIGDQVAMFEAIHGSAPDIAGKDIANPSGLLMAGVMMLCHLGRNDVAEAVENAWLKTLEDGCHTADIASSDYTQKKLGTQDFADAVIARLGQKPNRLPAAHYPPRAPMPKILARKLPASKKQFDGIDVFIAENNRSAEALAARLHKVSSQCELKLKMITNRGVKVYPHGRPETFCTDHWRCRFQPESTPSSGTSYSAAIKLLQALDEAGIEVIKTENLYSFNDVKGYSLGQGQ